MSLLRTRSLVLRSYPLGETSLIVVLLTAEVGLLRAVAKGARETRNRFRGLLEPGTPLDVLVYIKQRSELHLIREISPRGSLPRASASLQTLSLRLAALELVLFTSEGAEAVAGLFELLEDYLEIFQSGDEPGFAPFFAFEAALLSLHGVAPDPGSCGHCGRRRAGELWRFQATEGNFLCADCPGEGFDLATAAGDWLQSVFQSRPSDLRGRLLPDDTRRQVGRVLHLALSRHLPGYRLPRSLEMLRSSRSQGIETDEE